MDSFFADKQVWISVLCAFIALQMLMFVTFGGSSRSKRIAKHQDRLSAMATITGKIAMGNSKYGKSKLQYEFVDSYGKLHRDIHIDSDDRLKSFRIGDQYEVSYLREQPQVSELLKLAGNSAAHKRSTSSSLLVLALSVVALVAVMVFV